MNTFANSLFSLLFGWARTLIQQLWSSAVSGRYQGFLVWLGDHWLWVALALCVGGTVIDYMIWLVRWRPYLVWRSALGRMARRLRGEQPHTRRRFERGYQAGVALDIPMDPPALSPAEAWAGADWQAPAVSAEEGEAPETPQAPFGFPDPAPAYTAPGPEMPARQRHFTPPGEYEAPPMYTSSRAPSGYRTDLPSARRRRRSEKYERQRPVWREKLMGAEGEDALLDGLPPAVDRSEAFHEPVYPRKGGEPGVYTTWQRPPEGERVTDRNGV